MNTAVTVKQTPNVAELLTPEASAFLHDLHRTFKERRLDLLQKRALRQERLDQGEVPTFLPETAAIRSDDSWKVAPVPEDLQKRWVEITGPTDSKMVINALNSGADVFMADFEDANSPTWHNMVEGQLNLTKAIAGTLTFASPEGKQYKLNPKVAVLMVRPRGWHLVEKHFLIDGVPISASLFDFGLFLFHNARNLIEKGTGPYFYLPKLENHLEARLWNDVFVYAQQALNIPRGTIRATVLLETILAAFEMEEILFELREHISGLNAGRWDYIFSIIKKFHQRSRAVLPDRIQITMTVPFMRAYTDLLVKVCHQRGAHAIGGMAAFIPSRKDKEANELALAKVSEDKLRETSDGFDGTWVAHPDLVPTAHDIFAQALGDQSHQKQKMREDVHISSDELLQFAVPGGTVTEEGVRKNINVTLQYLDSWLTGVGAVAIFSLMEDAATAEISRAQLWQWLHHGAELKGGMRMTNDLYLRIAGEEESKIMAAYAERKLGIRKLAEARTLLDGLVMQKEFVEFLTLRAYEQL